MEASSSSDKFEYEVFLSFRGADVRDNFLSHLYEALENKGIKAFKDDKGLERGKSIESSLVEAIEKSKIALVVFSPKYTSSSWCLDELVEIVRCRDDKNQIVLPIFFKVNPSDVQEQTGIVAKAFEEHEQNVKNDKVQTWRKALSTVATIAGWDIESFYGSEADLVKCVVDNISDRLNCDGLDFKQELVGIDAHMKEMEKLLNLECNDVRVVGIWGTGGIGKSTIANFIYHKHSNKFDACYRLEYNQREDEWKTSVALQKEFISQFLSEKHTNFWDVDEGYNVIHKWLRSKKVLLVLDNVYKLEQLTALANVQLFGQGSRIIVTTRDAHLFAPFKEMQIYEVSLLTRDQALHLFCVHAFGKNRPPNDFSELSMKFVSYAHGLPLVLKVLGAHLCGRLDSNFWRSELDKLKMIPNTKIYEVLKISFDGLDDHLVKAVFLDIVLFFIGKNKVLSGKILDQCGYFPESAFIILKDKAMLTIENGRLHMHEMIQKMGREIVREESKDDPNKCSRLCDQSDDVCDILTHGKGSKKIEGISLSMSKTKALVLDPDTFTRMPNLRILEFKTRIQLPRGLSFLPEITYISWDRFSSKSLPSNFLGKNLVVLELRWSELKHLWTNDPELVNLVSIDLSYSKYLKTLPNLSKAIRIEKINLQGCESFVRFSHDLQHLDRLEFLNLNECTKFKKFPRLPPNLKELHLSCTKALILDPDTFTWTPNLRILEIGVRIQLPRGLSFLPEIKYMNWFRFPVKSLPSNFLGKNLVELKLQRSEVEHLWTNDPELVNLVSIDLSGSKYLKTLPSLSKAIRIEKIDLEGCESFVRFSHDLQHLVSLDSLVLHGCTKFDELPRLPPNLKELYLSKTAIKKLPLQIELLSNLESLSLHNCKNLSALPKFEVGTVEILFRDLVGSGIRELPESIVNLDISELDLSECTKLVQLPSCMHEFSSLKAIDISGCKSLCSLPVNGLNGNLCNLKFLNCIKLNTKACSEVVKHCKMVLHSKNDIMCIVPGNEIPDWFDHKSLRSSITIQSLPSKHQIKTVAFSVVIGPHHEYAENSRDLNFDRSDFHCGVKCNHHVQPVELWTLPCVDHVFVWSSFNQYFHGITLGSEFLFDFTLFQIDFHMMDFDRLRVRKSCHQLVIKKCGIHLITNVEATPTIPISLDDEGTQKWKAHNNEEADTSEESSTAK